MAVAGERWDEGNFGEELLSLRGEKVTVFTLGGPRTEGHLSAVGLDFIRVVAPSGVVRIPIAAIAAIAPD